MNGQVTSAALVGRQQELDELHAMTSGAGPSLAFLWGVGGVGKTTLMHGFQQALGDAGLESLWLDLGGIEPTPAGFTETAGEYLEAQAQDPARPRFLLMDGYECFGLMDYWLLQHLRPRLGPALKLVICGRRPPSPGWRTIGRDQTAPLLREVDELCRDDARQLIASLGVDSGSIPALLSLAGGHPLALNLAAAAWRGGDPPDSLGSELFLEMSRLYLEEVNDVQMRVALEAASIPRRLTRQMLSALLGQRNVHETFDRLSKLSFVRLRADGLYLHDTVRQAIQSALRASDPELFTTYRRRAWHALRAGLSSAGGNALWQRTADVIFLVDNPVVREAFFPSESRSLLVEPAQPQDQEAILALARQHDGDQSLDCWRAWMRTRPAIFHVVRGAGAVKGFYAVLDSEGLVSDQVAHDPLTMAWLEHLREQQPAGGSSLFIRRWLGAEDGESPGPVQAACWLDLKRMYMEMRPGLRRVYLTLADLRPYAEVARKLGFRHLENRVTRLGDRNYQLAVLEFGSGSVDGWIERLVASELGLLEGSLLDPATRELAHGDARTRLTPLEFAVMEMLLNQAGHLVQREALLEEIWGQDTDAGSNVVDVVVSGLRKKLPPGTGTIETIRGAGYSYRPSPDRA